MSLLDIKTKEQNDHSKKYKQIKAILSSKRILCFTFSYLIRLDIFIPHLSMLLPYQFFCSYEQQIVQLSKILRKLIKYSRSR